MLAYFDHNATTPVDSRVFAAMTPWFGEHHGNPSSAHGYGRAARAAIETARGQVAEMLGARANEVIFTSSGSEANNAVLYAVGEHCDFAGHLVLATFEHPSIQASAGRLVARGMTITHVAPGADGLIAASAVEDALRDDTRLVCLMLANNELGTVQPVAEVTRLCRERGIPVLCDAVQAVGKIAVDVGALGVEYLTLGGHKFHGPPGVAALWVGEDAIYRPLLVGGAQERGRRASTENVPAIVGLGAACALASQELEVRQQHLRQLRDTFEAGLSAIPDVRVHCQDAPRLPHTSNIAFLGLRGYDIMQRLDERGYAISTGAACHSGEPQPSSTVLALGYSPSEAIGALRISFGMPNTLEEVAALLSVLESEVAALRRSQGVTA